MAKKKTPDSKPQIEQKTMFQRVFEESQIGIVIADPDRRFIQVNDNFCQMLGYSRDEMLGKSIADITHAENIKADIEGTTLVRTGESGCYETEKRYIRKDGNILWGSTKVSAIHDSDGKFLNFIAMINDITARKSAEMQLFSYQTKIQKINDCITNSGNDHDANISSLTALCGELLNATCALFNRMDDGFLCTVGQWKTPADYVSRDKPEGHICYDVIRNNKDDSLIIYDLLNSNYALTDPNVKLYALKTYCGHVVRCEGKPVGSLCVVYQSDYLFNDDDNRILTLISSAIGSEDARRKYTRILEENERFLTDTENISKTGGWEYTVDTNNLKWTGEMFRIYGLTEDNTTVNLQNATSFYGKEDQELFSNAFNRALKEGIPWDMELLLQTADKQSKWVRTIGKAIIQDNKIMKVAGNLIDITDRKTAELKIQKHLEEQQALSRTIADILPLKFPEEVYQYIGKTLNTLTDGAFILISTVDKIKNEIRLTHTFGLNHYLEKITALIGKDPSSFSASLDELASFEQQAFKKVKLTYHKKDGLYNISNHRISKQVGKAIEKFLGLKHIYSIGLTYENRLFGGIAILSRKNDLSIKDNLIETIINQASIKLERLLSQEKLRMEHENLQAILSSSPVGMLIIDDQERIVLANQAAATTFNTDLSIMNGFITGDFLKCINRRKTLEGCGYSENCHDCVISLSIRRALREQIGIHNIEAEIFTEYHTNGESSWFRFSIEPIKLNNHTHLIVAFHDITENKKAEESLRRTHEHYLKIIEHAPDGIVLLNKEGRFLFISPSSRAMFGYTNEDAPFLNPDELTHPEDLDRVIAVLQKVNEEPELVPVIQYRFRKKDGTWRWIESTISNLYNEPSVRALVINFRDIHDRRLAEEALRESESKYRGLFEANRDGISIFYVNPDQSPGNFAEVNESAASMLGYTKEEFLSLNIFELEPGSSPAIAAERGSILLKDGYHSLETRFTHKNGHLIDVSLLIILTAYPQQAS